MPTIREARSRTANNCAPAESGEYVLYWCSMYRRLTHNHALDVALEWAKRLKKPLIVYEGVKLNAPWASARFHRFILEGMRDNAAEAKRVGAIYWPFVETPEQPGRGLVRKLCEKACVLVTDDYPQYIVPAQIRAIAARVSIPVIAVDGNSVIPLSLLGAPVAAAAHLRPRIHKLFAAAWAERADPEPVFEPVKKAPRPPFELWKSPADLGAFVRALPVDQSVPPVPGTVGGTVEAKLVLKDFLKFKLHRYGEERSLPDAPKRNAASGLSFYLHYGHLSIEEVIAEALPEGWTTDEINSKAKNKSDFYCRDASINSFLDEAITWRDVGYQWNYGKMLLASGGANRSWEDPGERPSFNFETYDFSPLGQRGTLNLVLPAWAKATLAKHAGDRREHLYNIEQFENAVTHDELWNAAQRELLATGRIHNYLRMLWAKKVLEWSESPEAGYRILEHLNNKYAIDGRDPNSYTGILWCFGLFDRFWPPEREVFGNIRYMSSGNTAKKFKLGPYLDFVRSLPTVEQVRGLPAREKQAVGLF